MPKMVMTSKMAIRSLEDLPDFLDSCDFQFLWW